MPSVLCPGGNLGGVIVDKRIDDSRDERFVGFRGENGERWGASSVGTDEFFLEKLKAGLLSGEPRCAPQEWLQAVYCLPLLDHRPSSGMKFVHRHGRLFTSEIGKEGMKYKMQNL